MTTLTTRFVKQSIATVIAAALVATAPGLGCYKALAMTVGVNVGAGVQSLPGGAAGAGLARLNPVGSQVSTSLQVAHPSLQGTLRAVPSLTPKVETHAGVVAAANMAAFRVFGPAALSRPEGALRAGANVRGVSGAPTAARAPTAASAKALLAQPRSVSLPAVEIARMSAGQAKQAGHAFMDRVLGRRSVATEGVVDSRAFANAGARADGLKPAASRDAASASVKPAAVPGIQASRRDASGRAAGKIKAFMGTAARMGLGAFAGIGIHQLAATLLPAVFGMVPLASVWAVSSGILLLPVALYSRYRLGLRDSSRLKGVKLFYDIVIGAFIGATALAVPQILSGAVLSSLALGLPVLVGATFGIASATKGSGGAGGVINAILAWASLNLLAPFIGAAGAAPLTLGGIFGLMALPAMTTISFFLGRIISSAETGNPFRVIGSVRTFRFPSYTWVMTGVVFALLTGYSPVWTNVVFGVWMMLGQKPVFNKIYLGGLAWAAVTGFTAPLTFFVIAFAPERAAMWTEALLTRMLKKGPPAPSTKAEPVEIDESAPARWPRFHYWIKTGVTIGSLAALGGVLGAKVFGFGSLFANLGLAGAMAFLPVFFSKKLIKMAMQATPMKESDDPEIFAMTRELVGKINAGRAAKGKKPIPLPEMVNVPMPVPNAFATGPSPMNAMVGVTEEMKQMTLNPARTREGLIRVFSAVEPRSEAFFVYRMAVRDVISGIAESAAPQEVIQAIQDASDAQIKAIGVAALRGVMAHELNHVMHRDIMLGAATGAMSSGIGFASYKILWAVGNAKAFFTRIFRKMTGGAQPNHPQPAAAPRGTGAQAAPANGIGRVKTEAFEPVTVGVAAQSILALVKVFACLWAPVLATLLQMGSSRIRESHADEGGGLLAEKPEHLAMGLGLLMSWRPQRGVFIQRYLLPWIASLGHIMTINPLEQLSRAGALPGAKASAGVPVDMKDKWLAELFLTHPDTDKRIKNLYKMASALKAGNGSGQRR
ncbi:MAG: M48 family metalloprotease [Elusimicrobiota bacterium]